jgi:hypothetical protein
MTSMVSGPVETRVVQRTDQSVQWWLEKGNGRAYHLMRARQEKRHVAVKGVGVEAVRE